MRRAGRTQLLGARPEPCQHVHVRAAMVFMGTGSCTLAHTTADHTCKRNVSTGTTLACLEQLLYEACPQRHNPPVCLEQSRGVVGRRVHPRIRASHGMPQSRASTQPRTTQLATHFDRLQLHSRPRCWWHTLTRRSMSVLGAYIRGSCWPWHALWPSFGLAQHDLSHWGAMKVQHQSR
jgi:hypothetical protein